MIVEFLSSQVAVQVTGVLRNLAVSPSHASLFVTAGVLRALRVTAGAMSGMPTTSRGGGGGGRGGSGAGAGAGLGAGAGHSAASEEVVLNVGRILSKLSLHEECQV